MLPLDHLPFPSPDLDTTAAAFAALGFTVSPPCVYTSPDYPEARWDNRSVFLRQGWFDLLHDQQAPAHAAGAPNGCLFRTDDLAAAERATAGMRRTTPYRLIRHSEVAPELGTESFALFSIRERIAPLVLTVIEHHYPCPDTHEDWFEHSNTAVEVAGLAFCGERSGPAAEAGALILDITGFRYLEEAEYLAAFGPSKLAVRVRVRSLDAAAAQLAAAGIEARSTGEVLRVRPPPPLASGFEFFEA